MQDILLLHGATGAKEQLYQLEQKLTDSFTVHSLNFSGHSGSAYADEPFSISLFALEVITFLDKKK